MSQISKKDLEHVGQLLAIKFDERSPQVTAEQLSSLLTSFGVVQNAKISNADDLTGFSGNQAPLRNDKLTSSLDDETVLEGAPRRMDKFILIKPVF